MPFECSTQLHPGMLLSTHIGFGKYATAFVATYGTKLQFYRGAPTFACAAMSSVVKPRTAASSGEGKVRAVSAEKAGKIDEALMSPPYCHTLEQLMELAGQAVAVAVDDLTGGVRAPLAIVCGPGNNGGDGLVAARHLVHFGYPVTLVYPKQRDCAPFKNLVAQLSALGVTPKDQVPEDVELIVDAIFGFSFNGEKGVREPFGTIIQAMNSHKAAMIAVDVPSGWHVDEGDIYDECVRAPDALISLTAPKPCANVLLNKKSACVHYVGGRFVPPCLCTQLDFDVPDYKGTDVIARIA